MVLAVSDFSPNLGFFCLGLVEDVAAGIGASSMTTSSDEDGESGSSEARSAGSTYSGVKGKAVEVDFLVNLGFLESGAGADSCTDESRGRLSDWIGVGLTSDSSEARSLALDGSVSVSMSVADEVLAARAASWASRSRFALRFCRRF